MKVAVVTGANRGIGFEICRGLARAGLSVILAARDAGKGDAAARTLREEGHQTEFRSLDVADADSIRTFAAKLEQAPGHVDVLVNNAGIMIDPRGSRLLDAAPATFRRTFETNVMGPLQLTQALLPFMQKRNYGRIVNVSSGQGQ